MLSLVAFYLQFYESLAIRTQQGHYFYVCPVTGDRITLGNIKVRK